MTGLFHRFKAWVFNQSPAIKIIAACADSTGATALNDHENLQGLVPYDENLLERSRTQWQFGDWASLALLSRDTLQHHPDRAKLALLCAAGHQAQGNAAEALQHTRLAIDWGCSKKLVSQILISGVHNTLGRAAAVSGQEQRAHKHFQASIEAGAPSSAVGLLTQARLSHQLNQLGLPLQTITALAQSSIGNHRSWRTALTQTSAPGFTVKVLAQHDLGLAWAANTVNTVIFRHHGILSSGNQQYTAFYVDEQTLRLVQRNLETDRITTHDLAGKYNLRDAHNSISLGVDRAGHLHMSYDHHGTQLRYRRSNQAHSIDSWTEEIAMTGTNEDRVTYPTFILSHHGHPLTLLYRDGSHNKGSARLKTYDEATQTWADHLTPILSGSDQKPWTSNAYWNHPATGSDGSLHLSFVWRIQGMGDEDVVNNTNIGYARSFDNGKTWQTSHGRPYKLPITQVNAETVYPVAPGSNLINQCSMALDSLNRPHIVFYADDANGIPQYQHLRYDGKAWHHTVLSQRTEDFALMGGGTLQIPISRPDIVLDAQDNAYVIYRGDLSHNRVTATRLAAPHYRYHPANAQALLDQDLGYAEPIIDRSRWAQDHTLTLLLQPNDQPNHDKQHQAQQRTVTLADIQFQPS
jgi:hypothetical protein